MAHSMDLRRRVLDAYDSGQETVEVARRFSVSSSWARRLKQRRAEGKSIAPQSGGGSKPKLDDAARLKLAGFVAEQPDATLEELRERIASELMITISIGALWQTLFAMKLPLKKSR